ncbi:MAG: hypothetical protein JO085_12395 [Acidimicrobiia bacterium]|nr:hypothetical protein [Acidimicrobiia bacterium]
MHDDDPTLSPPSPQHAPATDDPVLAALGDAAGALRRFATHSAEVLEAFGRVEGLREAGASYEQIAECERLFIDFAAGPYKELVDAVSNLRRQQVAAIYEEGMTMAQLGRLLGVTRQRIAVVLEEKRKRPAQ